MSAGLFGLLDDVAAIAKLAAASVDDVGAAAGKATAKAAGVVIDDTAVTPQYVQGITAEREIPIIKQIAIGSIRNKLLIILPVALVLSQWMEWLIAPILMLGGAYLAFEGAEKIWERIRHHDGADHRSAGDLPAPSAEGRDEQLLVSSAIRTDLILSTEIMVIALKEVADESFWVRLAILVVVAIAITIGVYGVVGLIVKMDDVGLSLAQRSSRFSQSVGRGLVAAMPRLLAVISVVGVVAMLWVGGHILLSNSYELGWHPPYGWVHDVEEEIHHEVAAVGGALGWLFNTFVSFVVGVVVGGLLVGLMHLLPFGHGNGDAGQHAGPDTGPDAGPDAEGETTAR
jgi:predicted DNA repair protein MutK